MDRLCWIVCLALMLPVVGSESAELNCGFPGLPVEGSVQLYTVNRGYSSVRIEDWAPAKQGHYVFYRCADEGLRVEYTHRTESRRCESGRWTESAPICAGKVDADGDVFGIHMKKDEDTSTLVDRSHDTCTASDAVQRGTSFRMVFRRQHRIYGVKLIIKEQPALHNVLWTVKGSTEFQSDFEAVEIHQKRLNSTDFFLVVGERMFETKWKSIMITLNSSSQSLQLCEIEIYALPDRCGHPEIPIHGRVEWRAFDLTAIYNCDPGYQMEPYTPIRHCLRGTWMGEEPLCKPTEECNTSTDPTAVIFCVVLAVLLVVAILAAVYVYFGYDLVKRRRSKEVTVCGLQLCGTEATEAPPPPVPADFARPLVENGYEVPQRIYEEIKDTRPKRSSARPFSLNLEKLFA